VKKRGGISVNTLWGELAWQLGGAEAYELVKQSDLNGTSPGKEILIPLISKYAPCVILVDELVAYVRQFEPGKSLPGGSYDSNLSFMQALMESLKVVPNAGIGQGSWQSTGDQCPGGFEKLLRQGAGYLDTCSYRGSF